MMITPIKYNYVCVLGGLVSRLDEYTWMYAIMILTNIITTK